MKYSLLTYTLALGFLSAAYIPMAMAESSSTATVNISGEVRNATCTLENDQISVTLDNVDVSDFKGQAGTAVGAGKTVELVLNNCTTEQSGLKIKVSGTPDSDLPTTAFKNIAESDAATGVGIELIDTDGVHFKPDGSSNAAAVTKVNNGYDIKYTAKYISTTNAVTSGMVKSQITIVFTYS